MRTWLFRVCALLFVATAVFHVVAMARAGVTARHLVFVGVNGISAALCLKRPRLWFPLYFFALTLQQLYSHGGDLITTWRTSSEIDWRSALVIVALPVLLGLSLDEERRRRSARDPAA